MSPAAVLTPPRAAAGGPAATTPLGLCPSPAVTPEALADVVSAAREGAERNDADATFPVAVLDRLRASGLLGLAVPRAYGGPGGTVEDVLVVGHALSRVCTSSGMIFVMHQQQVAALARHAAPELAQHVLPRVATGGMYLASVTTEMGTGGHLLSAEAALRGSGENLRLERTAPVVTGGEHADGYLITMRESTEAARNQVSLVYADATDLTVETLGGWDPLGMRPTRSVPMHLEGTVPAGNVVGGPSEFPEIVARTFGPLAHIGWATCWLGTAAGALGRTVSLLRRPGERARRDLSSDLLRARLSRIRQRLDVVHAMIMHALSVHRADTSALSGPAAQLLMNAVKVTASEQCLAAVDELVELAGMRHGYLRDSELGLERALRDLRSASLNYSNDRLHGVDAAMVLVDGEVCFA